MTTGSWKTWCWWRPNDANGSAAGPKPLHQSLLLTDVFALDLRVADAASYRDTCLKGSDSPTKLPAEKQELR